MHASGRSLLLFLSRASVSTLTHPPLQDDGAGIAGFGRVDADGPKTPGFGNGYLLIHYLQQMAHFTWRLWVTLPIM